MGSNSELASRSVIDIVVVSARRIGKTCLLLLSRTEPMPLKETPLLFSQGFENTGFTFS